MENTHTEANEERMSTREPSDGLFDDEIVKESEDTSSSHPYVKLNGDENWAPPSPSKGAAKTRDAQLGYIALLDGAGPESPEENEQEQTSHEAGETHKIKKEEHIDNTPNFDSKTTAEKKEIVSNGSTHDTKAAPDAAVMKVEEVSSDKDLKMDSLAKGQDAVPSLSIKEIDTEDNGAGALSEPEQGSEPGYIMVNDRALTPDMANTAAEVAETAAELDPREPTPPISDEEAGRIGFRRMSNTPIPQVADTAAEVADAAKLLDDEEHSGLQTPLEEKVHRFSYEGGGDYEGEDEPYRPRSLDGPTMTQEATPEQLATLPTLHIVPILAGKEHDADQTILSDIQEESIIEPEEQPLPPTNIEDTMNSGADAANDSDGRSKKQVKMASPLILPSLNPTPVYPNTPFQRSDGQLSAEEESEQAEGSSRAVGGPSISFTPATPRGSSMNATDPMDDSDAKTPTARSTAIEEKSSLIRSRKGNASPAPADRPLTPNSVRSAGKEAHERNFLKTFWRVLFVDWIGGFILRLCGGERRRAA